MKLQKLLKCLPLALNASLVIVILLSGSVGAASNISDAAYQANMSVNNSIAQGNNSYNQIASFTLNPQTYIDNYYLNSSISGVAIRDANGNDVAFMPPAAGTSQWSVFIPNTPAGTQNFKLYMSQNNLNGRQVLMPGSTGITYDFSNINIENNDTWQFNVTSLNINGSNLYDLANNKKLLVTTDSNNNISTTFDTQYITLGANNSYYLVRENLSSFYEINNSSTGKIWINPENKTYYNYKSKKLYKSADGISWELLSSNDNWNEMEYGNGLFIAINTQGNTSYVSSDGISFTEVSVPNGGSAEFGASTISYGNGLFVISNLYWSGGYSSTNGNITSRSYRLYGVSTTDGTTWTSKEIASGSTSPNAKSHGITNGTISIFGIPGKVWILRNNAVTNMDSLLVSDFNKVFNIADLTLVFNPNSSVCYSVLANNSVNKINLPIADTWNDMYFDNGKYYLLGNTYIISTTDGINWDIERSSGGPFLAMGKYILNKAKYLTIGDQLNYYNSLDLTDVFESVNNTNDSGNIWFNDTTKTYYNFNVSNKSLYKSTNGYDWSFVSSNTTWQDMIYSNGSFYVLTTSGSSSNYRANIQVSTNGTSFSNKSQFTVSNTFVANRPRFYKYGSSIVIAIVTGSRTSTKTYYVIYSNDDGTTWAMDTVTTGSTTQSIPTNVVSNGNIKLAHFENNNNFVYVYRNSRWTKITTITYGFNYLLRINDLDLLFYPDSNICYSILSNNSLETINLPVTDTWNNYVYLNEKYYLLGNTYIISTTDGTNWNVEASEGPYLYFAPYSSNDINIDFIIGLIPNVEQNVTFQKINENTYNLLINDVLADSIIFDENLYLSSPTNILTSDLVNYLKNVSFNLNNSPEFEWKYSNDGNLYDSTGNGHNASVSYVSTFSPSISITINNFQPLNINQGNESDDEGSEEGGGSSMIDPDEASITVIDTDTENWNRIPVFKELAKDLRNSDWPVDLVLSLVVVLIDMLLCFLIYRFTRNQLTSGIVALVLLGYFVIMGCIPLFALVTGIVAELAIMTKRKVISY